MKKRYTMFLAVLLSVSLLFPVSALAAQAEPICVEEAGLVLTAPEGWVVFRPGMPENASAYSVWEGIDREYMERLMVQNRLCYNAVNSETPTQEIVVTVSEEQSWKQHASFDEAFYRDVAKELRETEMESGFGYGDETIVEHDQGLFLKMDGALVGDEETVALVQYLTVADGRLVTITLRDYSGGLSEEAEAAFDRFIQNAVFVPAASEEPGEPLDLGRLICWIAIAAVVVAVLALLFYVLIVKRKKEDRELLSVAMVPVEEPAEESIPPVAEEQEEPTAAE